MNRKESRPRKVRRKAPSGAATTTVARTLRSKKPKEPEYTFRLFISGLTPRSQRAIDNLQSICKRYLAGRYRIEVVDLHQSPASARDEQIVATPTLLKVLPPPPRRVIGDLSQLDRVLHGLDIQ